MLGATVGYISYPNDFIPNEEKNGTWIRKYIQAMWSNYLAMNSNIGYSNRGQYAVNRMYAMGTQPNLQYKNIANFGLGDADIFEDNINWQTLNIGSKFKQIIKGKMQNTGWTVTARAVNPEAIEARRQHENNLAFNVLFGEQMNEIKRLIGEEPIPADQNLPKTLEEVNIYMSSDYKSNGEIMAEVGWDLIAQQNDWNVLRDKIADDIIECGIAGTKEYLDSNGAVRIRIVNPENLVTGWTERPDFKDCRHFGEVRLMTIQELRQLDSLANISLEEWDEIAQQHDSNYNGFFNTAMSVGYATNSNRIRNYPFDGIRIPVLEAEFKSINNVDVEQKIHPNGNYTVRKNEKERNKQGSKYEYKKTRKQYEVWYKGSWIIGTDYIFDFGMVTNMRRAKTSLENAYSNYHIYAPNMYNMRVRAIMEDTIAPIDQINLAFFKMQIMLAKARPKGSAIDVNSLIGIGAGDGGDLFTVSELRDIRDKTGDLLYNSLAARGEVRISPPVDQENGMSNDVMRNWEIIDRNIALLNSITGINSVVDASNPNPEVGKAQSQIAIQSSNNALSSLMIATKNLLQQTAKGCIMSMQESIRAGNSIEGWTNALGSSIMQYIKVNKDVCMYDFGIWVENVDLTEERNVLMGLVQQELAIRTQGGQGGLLLEDALEIYEVMKSNLKMARNILKARRKQRQEEDTQKQQAIIQEQQQGALQAAQGAEQAKQQTLMLEYKLKTEYELTRIQAEQQSKASVKEIEMAGNMAITELKMGMQSEAEKFKMMMQSEYNALGKIADTMHRREEMELQAEMAQKQQMAQQAQTGEQEEIESQEEPME